MTRKLHLTIATPAKLVVDCASVVSLRAADASGSFGILAGHARMASLLIMGLARYRIFD